MKRKSSKIWLVIPAIILVVCAGLIHFTGLLDFIPSLRVSAKSPDGELTVMVYQQRLSPRPFFPRMGAIAKVYDRNENLVYENIIYHDDDWDDTVGTAFNQIDFQEGEIHIRPGAYDKNKAYIIKKADLKMKK